MEFWANRHFETGQMANGHLAKVHMSEGNLTDGVWAN
jgi:hypothetical protein